MLTRLQHADQHASFYQALKGNLAKGLKFKIYLGRPSPVIPRPSPGCGESGRGPFPCVIMIASLRVFKITSSAAGCWALSHCSQPPLQKDRRA